MLTNTQLGHFSPVSFCFSLSNHLYPLLPSPLIPLNIPKVVLYNPKDVLPLHAPETPNPCRQLLEIPSFSLSMEPLPLTGGDGCHTRPQAEPSLRGARSEAPFLWMCYWISPACVPLCSFPFVEISLESRNPAAGQTHVIIWIKLCFKNKSKKQQMDIGRQKGENRNNENVFQ